MAFEYLESETVELKREYTDEIRKSVIAFANTNGGRIFIGIADNGEIIGVSDIDFVIQQLTNSIRDNIKPDVTMFTSYEIIQKASRNIVAVHIQRGTERPYYLGMKGLRPAGVFVRQGTSSVPASDTCIRQMIKDTDGELFENMRSLEQNLTFEYAGKTFKAHNVDFGYVQMKSMGMIVDDTIYTNLALLVSDQCPHIIKAAVFNGVDQFEFQDRCEFTGSLFKQLDDAYAYLEKYNKLHASFEGLLRIDAKDYPSVALREALLNAIIHRDYAYASPSLVSIYDDRVEMVSIGGFVQGMCLEDLLTGVSICRNPKLANVFYRLQLIEAYGTGLRKIIKAYANLGKQPEFKVTPNAFKVIIPNSNYQQQAVSTQKEETAMIEELDSIPLRIYGGTFTRKDIEEKLHVSTATAARILRKLLEREEIVCTGQGKNRCYKKAK